MIWTPLALMVALIVYMFFGIQVGMARGRYGVKAPAVSGHPEFERYFRVQMNTLEQLMVIVPSSVAFAYFVGDMWAAIAVTVFIVGRLVYFRSYIADPDSRGAGFGLSALPGMVMLIGTIIAIVLRLLS
ncbi:MAG: MAPEG family protein [Pseudomonadales bacterium]|nr:MAPEG family protein [Pseudomonadales bacterium]